MGMALALGYIAPDRIGLRPGPDDSLLFGKAVTAPLDDTRGPYILVDSRGYQMLMDYRGGAQPFPLKSVADIMNGDEAAALVRSRVVIVGVAARASRTISRRRSAPGSIPPTRSMELRSIPTLPIS